MTSDDLKKILITQDGKGKVEKQKALDLLLTITRNEVLNEILSQEPDHSEFDSKGQ